MKASEQCPKCESLKVGMVEVPDGDALCTMFRHQPVGMKKRETSREVEYVPVGQLEAWVCTECGYYETYVKAPSTVPFEELVGFRWLHPQPPEDGPYR